MKEETREKRSIITFPSSPSANYSYPSNYSSTEEKKEKEVTTKRSLEDKASLTEYVAYNKHKMLNPPYLTATSGITCIDSYQMHTTKMAKEWEEEEGFRDLLVEIMDCQGKIRLHNRGGDFKDFKNKIKILRNELDLFLTHLENTPTPEDVIKKAKRNFPNKY